MDTLESYRLCPLFLAYAVPLTVRNITGVEKKQNMFHVMWQTIGLKHGTDKAHGHSYMPTYQLLLSYLQEKDIQLLEFGIASGSSLRMWRELFPFGHIYGVDSEANRLFVEKHIETIHGRQEDPELPKRFPLNFFDVMIDDAGHHPVAQQACHKNFWPLLKVGGWYFVEDIQVPQDIFDYWGKLPEFFGCFVTLRDGKGDYCADDILVVLRKTEKSKGK